MARFQSVIPDGEEGDYAGWPMSPAVIAGPFVLCSGAVGMREDGSVPDDPATQFEVAFENLHQVLETADATLSDVADLVTFHRGFEHFAVFSDVMGRFIASPKPAWTAVSVDELGAGVLPGVLVELKATAYRG